MCGCEEQLKKHYRRVAKHSCVVTDGTVDGLEFG
jgi:hypothetical protein